MKQAFTLIALVALSSIATADGVSWLRSCDQSCMAVNCDGERCWMWRCDASGCAIQTEFAYQDMQPHESDSKPFPEDVPMQGCLKDRCAIQVCDRLQCTIFGLEADRAKLLGRFDNVETEMKMLGQDFLRQSIKAKPDSHD